MKHTSFAQSEQGAVTVDWVVLTAALVGLGLATMAVVSSGVENISGDIDGELKRDDIISTQFTGIQLQLASLPMRVFTPTQKQESFNTIEAYDDATLLGMIGMFESQIDGQDLTQDPYAAFADSLDIANLERERRDI